MTLWRHLPNAICILRILLTLPIVVALEQGQYSFALSLFAVAAVSDGVDGYLAKRFGWISELGKFLDPLADKILLVSVFLACVWQELVPVWLAAAAIARDVLISAGVKSPSGPTSQSTFLGARWLVSEKSLSTVFSDYRWVY